LNYVSLYVQIGQFLVGMCLAPVFCRLLNLHEGIIYNINALNGTSWLMIWADNPVGDPLVEHGYSFARLQFFGGPWHLDCWFPHLFGNDSAAGFV
jgi:hypothetical protein